MRYTRQTLTMLFFLASLLHAKSQVFDNAEEAFRKAAETDKTVLLIFAGSDWCAPCIRFDKNILSDKQFQDFAAGRLVILKADFPQRKKLSKALQQQNDALAEQYNPAGIFPSLVLLRADHSVLKMLSYQDEASELFISKINLSLDHEQARRVQKTN